MRGTRTKEWGAGADATEFAYTVDLLNLKITPESVGRRERFWSVMTLLRRSCAMPEGAVGGTADLPQPL